MTERSYDLLVLGAGPGGYSAAVRAARAGLRVGLIEREQLGGVCLNWGCIPTKALLHSAALWRELKGARRHGIRIEGATFDYEAVLGRSRQVVARLVRGLELLMTDAGVEVLKGSGALIGSGGGLHRVRVGEREVAARRVILAAGSVIQAIPDLPFDGRRVMSSRDAIVRTSLPRSLLVVGAGAIGLEFADLYATFGVAVTVIEMMPQILPGEEPEIAQVLRNALAKRGIRIHTGVRLAGAEVDESGVRGRLTPAAEGGGQGAAAGQAAAGEATAAGEVAAECALVAVGVRGAIREIGLEACAVATAGGFVSVNAHQETSAAGIYAIGDLTGGPLLAHAAAAEGIRAVEHILGVAADEGRAWIPGAVFTHPQVASVGARERDLKAAGRPYRTGTFPFSSLGKAVAEGEVTGFVKILLDADGDSLLGAHVVGPHASELIAELTLAGAHGISAQKLLHTVHTHPTFSEAIPEAVGLALGLGIHG